MFETLKIFSFILLISESFEISSTIFTQYSKDKLSSAYYSHGNVSSRAGCVYSCFVDDQCFGVAYHTSRQMCYLYDKILYCVGQLNVIDVGMVTLLPKDAFIENIALHKPVNSSSKDGLGTPCRGVDGSQSRAARTQSSALEWWCVDMEGIYNLQSIFVYNGFAVNMDQIIGFELRLSYTGLCTIETYHGTTLCYKDTEPTSLEVYNITSCNQANEYV
ncbi:hypothetical protein LOTGIDRAFT_174142 [Lottia gigantea]|uniref:Apple domain-containing protein n=1 Tax=Lottia gigantea TaxID=225164 RepID=V4AN74_LOTGI|nr:hypothetical protein LOTGIDRAFT_174142 [Lottia gigantea]ESO98607.1 hypothetical protein LOTGIDRAFT_174142 [Lottia gigantea]